MGGLLACLNSLHPGVLCHRNGQERRSCTSIKLHARAPHTHAHARACTYVVKMCGGAVNTSPSLAALHNNTRVGGSDLRPRLHCIYGQQDLVFLADFTACLVSTMPPAVRHPSDFVILYLEKESHSNKNKLCDCFKLATTVCG